jgi:histidyl-tRNA synthetase
VWMASVAKRFMYGEAASYARGLLCARVRSIESRISGFYDVLDDELRARNVVHHAFVDVGARYGFREIRTTSVDLRERYLRATDVASSKIFEVRRPKEGSVYALQSDLGMSMSRFVADLGGAAPLKFVQVAGMFRDRPAKTHHFRREFEQALVGVWGIPDASADAEVIAATVTALASIPEVRLAHVLVSNHGFFECLAPGLASAVRFDDRGIDVLADCDLEPADRHVLSELFALNDVSIPAFREYAARFSDRRLRRESEIVEQLISALQLRSMTIPVRFSLSNLSGTGHYSGLTFSVYVLIGANNALLGVSDGGRIDALCTRLTGARIPATCLGTGVTVLAQLLDIGADRRPAVVLFEDADGSPVPIAIADCLRDADVDVSLLGLPHSRWRTVLRSPFYHGSTFILHDARGTEVRGDCVANKSYVTHMLTTAGYAVRGE